MADCVLRKDLTEDFTSFDSFWYSGRRQILLYVYCVKNDLSSWLLVKREEKTSEGLAGRSS